MTMPRGDSSARALNFSAFSRRALSARRLAVKSIAVRRTAPRPSGNSPMGKELKFQTRREPSFARNRRSPSADRESSGAPKALISHSTMVGRSSRA
jgi:hypothetical protein